jgi:ligand-binding SRPBCC domain-containing protein
MPEIWLDTFIKAKPEVVFDLARSVDVHLNSMTHARERVVQGKTSGLFEAGDVVTWQARHLGVMQHLTVKITEVWPPEFLEDVMVRGAFAEMRHQHFFEATDGGTKMTDKFFYRSPLGILGKMADRLFLERYMRDLLISRNAAIKALAERA